MDCTWGNGCTTTFAAGSFYTKKLLANFRVMSLRFGSKRRMQLVAQLVAGCVFNLRVFDEL